MQLSGLGCPLTVLFLGRGPMKLTPCDIVWRRSAFADMQTGIDIRVYTKSSIAFRNAQTRTGLLRFDLASHFRMTLFRLEGCKQRH
jgi:hypothetical protein